MRPTQVLGLAAESLQHRDAEPHPRVAHLLEALEYARGDGSLEDSDPHDIKMLQFAAQFEEFFQLDSPDAPGLAFFGGLLSQTLAAEQHGASRNVSVSGRGMTLRKAFEGCVGEAVEYVSQLDRFNDRVFAEDIDAALDDLDPMSMCEMSRWLVRSAKRRIDWMHATRLSDGECVRLPADVCLRRPPACRSFVAPFLLGTGTAAGATPESATLHAVLELIERDALGLWWRGGRRGMAVDHEAAQFEMTIAALRRGRGDRTTWLLDLSTELGVTCIAALSCSADGGRFAFGAAARLNVADAARVALLELCQLELALHLVERKAEERGPDALNSSDLQHRLRADAINAKTCKLLQPLPEKRAPFLGPRDLNEIVAHASKLGFEFHRVDLTRPMLAIPAARVVAPALQLEPSQIVTARLQRVIDSTGGGDAYTRGIPLL